MTPRPHADNINDLQIAHRSAVLVEALQGISLIDGSCRSAIERLWKDRGAFLLRKESDTELEEFTRSTLGLLEDIAGRFFGHSERDGIVIPDHPEYWLAYEAEMPVLAGQ
jgi:hypothetical protein